MFDQSFVSAYRAVSASLSVSTMNSAHRNSISSLGTSRRGLAWARGIVSTAAALVLGAFCVPAQAQVTLATNWYQQSPATSPSLRWDVATAYDSGHGQVVMFGGLGSPGTLSETWLWNGTTWSQANPATVPPARANQAMAYDALHGQVVMFGGINSLSTRTNDTWLWNGTNWTQAAPANSPPARGGASMVFDAALGQVVLFGGLDVNGNALGDTWLWNGTTWTNASPSTSPTARFDYAMAYDAAHGQVVLFGGLNGSYLNDTWLWSGSTWTQQAPAISPGARYGNGMDYDAALGQVVMFGGYSGSTYLSDTWTWNGTNWTEQSFATNPALSYATNSMVYDAADGGLVLFEGYDGDTDFSYTFVLGTSQNFGSVNVCPTGQSTPVPCSATQTLTYSVPGAPYFDNPQVVVQGAAGADFTLASGSTCVPGPPPLGYCSVNVTFTPQAPGLRMGAVELFDSGGNLLVTTPIYGVGQGSEIAFSGSPAVVNLGGSYSFSFPVAVDAAGNIYFTAGGQAYKKTSSGVQTLPSAGEFFAESGIAVDGAGDVFIADNEQGRVFELPANGGAQTTAYPPQGIFGEPRGVAVDGQGDIFVADSDQNEVVKIPANGGSNTVVYGPPSGGASVASVAVDGAGDLFVALNSPGSVVEIPAGCSNTSCQKTVGTGWNAPASLAVDAAGSVYVADPELAAGNGEIVQVPPGCSSSVCQYVLANGNTISGGVNAESVAVDGQGNVYYINTGSNENGVGSQIAQLYEISRSQTPSLTFDTTLVGSTSADSPQSFTALNVGNQTLSAISPGFAATGPNFYQVSGTGTPVDCLYNFSLAPGADCNVSISFEPQTSGSLAGTANFTDNSLNGNPATQSPYFSGSATAPAGVPLTLSGQGNGVVVSTPPGINCTLAAGIGSGTCTANFPDDSLVSLQETPSAGYAFQAWSGCAGSDLAPTCSFTITGGTSATASFTPGFPLTVTEVGTGSGTVTDNQSQISCIEASGVVSGVCSGSYAIGTQVTLTVTGTGTATFVGWGGACASAGPSPICNVTINAAETVNASFVAPGASQAGILKPITAGVVWGQGGSFTSVAGNAGAGGLNNPVATVVDANGNLYVADRSNNRVLYYPAGSTTATRVYGQNGSFTSNGENTGGVSANSLNQPWAVALDSSGNLYIADQYNYRVLYYPAGSTTATRVYGQNGSFTSAISNNGGISANSLSAPQGLAVDSGGNLYVSDSSRVLFFPAGTTTATRVYGQGGSFTTNTVNNGGVSANSLDNTQGIAVDSSGDLYVADIYDNRVLFYPEGSTTATRVYGQNGSFTSNTANNGGVSANSMNQPQGLALDSGGNLYVTEYLSNRMLFFPFGSTTATRVYGQGSSFTSNAVNNGGVSANSLNQPTGVALDASGNLYVADIYNNRVVEYGPFGNVNVCPSGASTPAPCSSTYVMSYYAGSTTTFGATQVVTQGVSGVDFTLGGGSTCMGTVNAGNTCNANVTFTPLAPGLRMGAVELLDGGGNVLATQPVYGVGQGPAIAISPGTQTVLPFTGLNTPSKLALDAAGDLFVVDYSNNQVVKLTSGGIQTTVPTSGLSNPAGVAVDGAGNLFIADNQNTRIVEIPAGCTSSACQVTVPITGLSNPYDVAVDGAGNLYIADAGLPQVVKYMASGVQTTVPSTTLGGPFAVAVDAAGDVFIADTYGNQVLEVTAGGVQTTVPTVGVTSPEGVWVDAAGDVFVADWIGNSRIVEVPAGGGAQTLVYTGNAPEGVVTDGAGDIFIADTFNSQVVEISDSQPSVNLGIVSQNYQSTDTPITMQNVGNQPLTGAIGAVSGAYFFEDVPTSTCTTISLNPGASCVENFFALSTAVGPISANAVANDNSLNGSPAIQTINLSALSVGPTVTVTATGGGTGSGVVVQNPTGINCGFVAGAGSGTCSSSMSTGLTISFQENPTAGSTFTGWGGACASYGAAQYCTVLVTAATSVTASFAAPITNYMLTLTEVGNGTGTVADNQSQISCSETAGVVGGPCTGSYPGGTLVTLAATPAAGSTFLGWGGACSSAGTSLQCNVTMNSAASATATFGQGNFGNVNVCPSGVNTPAPCSGTLGLAFNFSTTTTIGAIEVVTQGVTGLDFSLGSSGTCTGTVSAGNSCTVNVSFAPLAPGLRQGAVELFDNNANLLTTAPIYGIGQSPEIAFGPGTQTTIGTGSYTLNQAKGLALDAAGDLFIADTLNQRVVKIGANGTKTTVGFGLLYPQSVAVDGAGDVFIADNNLGEVIEVPAGCTISACQIVLVSQQTSPYQSELGVAVDAVGDVFFSDFLDGQVVKIPANGGAMTVVYNPTGSNPVDLGTDAAGDLFIADFGLQTVAEVPVGCTSSSCWKTIGTGWQQPDSVSVDAAGDVFVADHGLSQVVEVPAGCISSACQIVVASGINTVAATVDTLANVFISNQATNQIVEINLAVPPSLSFALTNAGSTSTDSPQLVSIQNVGNQPLAGSAILSTLGTNFTQNVTPDCSSEFPLAPGATCSESFSFTPQSTGYLTGTASFSDNTFNLSPLVSLQTVNLSGSGGLNGQPVGVLVPNVVGLTQAAAAPPITGAGLAMGTVSTASSSVVPSGSVIASNPPAGTQVTPGSAVRLLVSNGQPAPPTPNPLTLENNYFVTGDYASAGVTLRGRGIGGIATGTITIPSSTANPGVSQGVPDGADIIDGFLYWETLENTPAPSGGSGTFLGYPIVGQQIGSDLDNYTDGAFTGTLRVYRADVNTYFPGGTSGVRFASGSFTVSMPDSGGTGLPLTEGASLVVIYRVLSPNFPLKSVVIYDGAAIPTVSTTQGVQGFYDALGGTFGTGESTTLFAAGGGWNNNSGTVTTPAQSSQFNAPLNAGSAYAAVILSTPVANSDNDGILDSWKAGPVASDFYGGQPGYYDVKSGSWVPLPGAKHGEKDLFVQMDYMCGSVLSNGTCDPSQENLFPSADAQGNDPLAIVTNAFAADGVVLHLEVGNAVPEDICTDTSSTPQSQLCQFPSQPGVIGWKNSLEFSKLWPKNLASCAGGGDCSPRFPYGQKDSYHYVLFGHSLAIPAWNSRYGTLTSINVVNGVTTIGTTDRGAGINQCPGRITLSGVLGNPSLNGVYNTTSCPDTKTITINTPGVPNWSFPNNTLPEPVIGLTSGTVTSISGYSDLGGADSAVTLGLWETAPNQNMSKRANVIAGTLFHEIGHTLGLSHGGLYYQTPGSYIPNFDVNCKPNYQSVMNYLFQLDGVGPGAAVAYSNQTLETLTETSLASVTNLTDGFGNPATFSTSAWYTTTAPSPTASAATAHCDGTPLTGDTGYRVNGAIAPVTPSWSNGQNIAFDGVPYTQMLGYNDVANMDLRQVGATGGEFASLANVLNFGSSQAPLTIAAGGSASVGAGGTVTLGSGGSLTLLSRGTVTLGSGGTIALGSGGDVTLGNGGNATLSTGGTVTPGSNGLVTLGSGGAVTLSSFGTITLGSGGTVTVGNLGTIALGSGGTITSSLGIVTIPSSGGSYLLPPTGGIVVLGSGGNITLGSGGTVTLGSGGNIALGSGGNIALGSGGNVTLGSGGTITMGSGGNVTLGSGGNVTLGSGGIVTLGSGGNLTLGSGGNVTLGSGGTVTLGSGGNVTLGSGGNVTLGSGGTVALGSGGTLTLGSGGSVTLSSIGTITLGSGGAQTRSVGPGPVAIPPGGGTITLGSGGTIALGSGGNVTLGSGGTITMGSGGTVTLGSGGNVTLGSGGVVALGSGGNVTLGSGGNIALGSGGNVTLGSGGASTDELTYETANSVVRPPSSPTETPTPAGTAVVVNWTAPAFGVVSTYTISRSSDGAPPIVIGSVSGVNGNPPATTFTDTNPDLTSQTVVYTISTTLLPVAIDPTQRQSAPSAPAVLTNDQTIVLGALPSSVPISTSTLTVTATAESHGAANGLQVNFSTTGSCTAGSPSIDPASGISSATVALNNTGSCTITASQPGSNLTPLGTPPYYNPANSVSGTVMVLPQGSNLQSQTILFPQLPSVQYGSTFSLSASSSSGLAVSFAASGPCTTSGSISGVGVCTITASAPANSTYSAASVAQSFNINPAVLKVTATSVSVPFGQPLPALASTYSGFVNNESPSVVSGAPALSTTATQGSNPGNYPITVSTGTLAAANYSFLYVSGTLTIQSTTQAALILNTTSPLTYNQSETMSVTGGSTGGAVTYNLTGGPCAVSGSQLTANSGTGSCTLTATMAGNSSYSSITSSPATVTLGPASQTITFTTNPPVSAGFNTSFTVAATGGASGKPVTFTSSGACSNSGATYTMTSGAGSCSVIASQAGNTNYAAATPVTKTVNSTLATPTVTFTGAPPSAAYNSHFTVATTTNASTTAVITSSGACSNSGTAVTMTSGTGTCSLTATWAADSKYSGTTASQSTIATLLAQAITFTTNPPVSAAYNSSFTVAATGGASGNAVTFTSSGACSNSGAIYTMTNSTGSCSVIASQAGNTNYSAAPPVTKTVNATGPSVTVSPSNISFGTVNQGSITTKNITVTNTGTASVTINDPILSIVRGGDSNEFIAVNLCLTPLAAGKSCTITIAFIAGPYYTPQTATLQIMDNAPGSPQPVTLSATVLIPQTITFTTNPPSSAAYHSSFTVAATGGASANAVTFTSSGACSNSGATYTMTSGTGTCSVIANQAGNTTYAAAAQVTRNVSATLAAQTISFTTNPPSSAAYHSSFTVAATGGASANAVTFTSSGACSNSGATYTMTSSTGTCSVIANQAGNSSYSAAPQVTKTVSATVATQAITITTNPPSSAAYKSSFTVAATGGGSGNAVTFTSSGACSNSGATYTMTSSTGTCSVTASQAGNSNYSAAAPVTKTVSATVAAQAITFTTNPPASASHNSSFTVAAAGGGSGNAVTFTSSGACTNSGAKYTMTSATGTCSVIASQAGNSNYAAASPVTKSVTAKQ